MSVAAHIRHLEEKHALLEAAIAQESKRPSPNFQRVSSLKKQKLRVKEMISMLLKQEPRFASGA